MKILKNRMVIGIACIVLALIICFGVTPLFNSAISKQAEITRITQNVEKGTRITDSMIETVKVGGYNLPNNVLKKKSDVVGKYATAALQKGDYILSTKVSNNPSDTFAYLNELDGNKQAISISIKSFAAGLSGKLESGDVVSLIASDYGDLKETVVPSDLKYVKLLAATTNNGADNNYETATATDKQNTNTKNEMPSTLTLLVTPEQAKSLVEYETKGKLHATLVYRGTAEAAKKFLDQEDSFLAQQTQSSSKATVQNKTGGTSINGQ